MSISTYPPEYQKMWFWKQLVVPIAGFFVVVALVVATRSLLVHEGLAVAARPRQPAAGPTRTAPTRPVPAPAIPPQNVAPLPTDDGTSPVAPGTQPFVADVPHNPQHVPLWMVEANLLAKTNAARVRSGLAPLELDPQIQKTCRQHCTWMAAAHSMTHGRYPVAENIAMGQRWSDDVIRTWLNSPGHRANMLNSRYTRVGVAGYISANGTKFWCQQFR